MANTPKQAVRHIPRRSDTGQFTTPQYAQKHPKTTEVETIRYPKKK